MMNGDGASDDEGDENMDNQYDDEEKASEGDEAAAIPQSQE
jgi:hypothetical protein